jgi:hypothetical protein
MTASLGIRVIRSSLTDWRSMKKECRHARHMFEHRNFGKNRRKRSEIFFENLRTAYKDLIQVKNNFKIISCLCIFNAKLWSVLYSNEYSNCEINWCKLFSHIPERCWGIESWSQLSWDCLSICCLSVCLSVSHSVWSSNYLSSVGWNKDTLFLQSVGMVYRKRVIFSVSCFSFISITCMQHWSGQTKIFSHVWQLVQILCDLYFSLLNAEYWLKYFYNWRW